MKSTDSNHFQALRRFSAASYLILMLSCCCLFASKVAVAEEKELIVATKVAPPFAMLGADNEWRGLSIALWEALAQELGIKFRYEEATLADMIDGVADGRFDASISAITITHDRESLVDFTHPFYTTGYGIAVPQKSSGWMTLLDRLSSVAFLQAMGTLVLLLTVVGICFWLAERRKNREEFRPGMQGVGDGIWFSAVTMTTTGYGDMAPRTWAGRAVGLVWMFTALVITSTLTGTIASSLTAHNLTQIVRGPEDLSKITTGSITDSSSDGWLRSNGLHFTPYETVNDGLDGVAKGEVGSFVYDRPLIRYLVEKNYAHSLELVPGTFGREDYGIALPQGSELREPLNRELLIYLDTGKWDALQRRWLGPVN